VTLYKVSEDGLNIMAEICRTSQFKIKKNCCAHCIVYYVYTQIYTLITNAPEHGFSSEISISKRNRTYSNKGWKGKDTRRVGWGYESYGILSTDVNITANTNSPSF
jgi:hypothetical protein